MGKYITPRKDVAETFTLLRDDMPNINRTKNAMTFVQKTYVFRRSALRNQRRRNPI